VANVWRRVLYASLPALMFGGCDCSGCGMTTPGCQPVTCDLREKCAVASDCKPDFFDPLGPCDVFACVGGHCQSVPAADGTAPPEQQTPGDCQVAVCSAGELTQQPENDPPSVSSTCQVGSCQDGSVVIVDSADGVACALDGGFAACVGGTCLRLPTGFPGVDGGPDAGLDDAGGDGGPDAGDDAGDAGQSQDAGDGGDTGDASDAGTCSHCADVLYGADPATLCLASQPIYSALSECTCGPTCGGACVDSLCEDVPADLGCGECVASILQGCGVELTNCNDDF
jgi:hypothetical protein